ncbi:hypothetical protein D3C75_738320 [compost metagenome]
MAEVEADVSAASAHTAQRAGQKSHAFGQGSLQQRHRIQALRQRHPQEHPACRQRIAAALPGRTLQELRHQLQTGVVFPVQERDMLPQVKGRYIQQMMQQPLVE